jgi:PspAA-like protein
VIVRILGEGQVDVPDSELDSLNELDDALQRAVDGGDEEGFSQSLTALLSRVRDVGRPLPDDEIVPSDLVLPSADASLAEVRELLGDEGLIPG